MAASRCLATSGASRKVSTNSASVASRGSPDRDPLNGLREGIGAHRRASREHDISKKKSLLLRLRQR